MHEGEPEEGDHHDGGDHNGGGGNEGYSGNGAHGAPHAARPLPRGVVEEFDSVHTELRRLEQTIAASKRDKESLEWQHREGVDYLYLQRPSRG
ncbi:MAG: hypothetical protein HY917_02100, partial [Candidatus Diapherotrites archaeon]|nr:hypothetical protein [Candidatus Diapherotrites archaeon]